jgi:uncharacterized repeat protein (TIGR01451 family)
VPASLLLVACSGAALTALSACGGGNGQVSVTVNPDVNTGRGPFKPGETERFVVDAVNHGPGDAPGVVVRVDMPGGFRYKSTENITGLGNARTQPVDPSVGVSDPQWGFWDLATPNPGAGPQYEFSHVEIHFTVTIGGSPSTYTLTGHAEGDNTSGSVASSPLPVTVKAAAKLNLTATVSPTTVGTNSVATYRVTITNSGDGPAHNVSALIALPPVMGFEQSVTPFPGNAGRVNPVDPVKNSVEVFYSGFELPADSSAGPGIVTIVFKAAVVARATRGAYPINVQVTDADQDEVFLQNAAPVMVTGIPPTPTPG